VHDRLAALNQPPGERWHAQRSIDDRNALVCQPIRALLLDRSVEESGGDNVVTVIARRTHQLRADETRCPGYQ